MVDAKDGGGSYILSDARRAEYPGHADSLQQTLLTLDSPTREILDIHTSQLDPAEKDRLVVEQMRLADESALDLRNGLADS